MGPCLARALVAGQGKLAEVWVPQMAEVWVPQMAQVWVRRWVQVWGSLLVEMMVTKM